MHAEHEKISLFVLEMTQAVAVLRQRPDMLSVFGQLNLYE